MRRQVVETLEDDGTIGTMEVLVPETDEDHAEIERLARAGEIDTRTMSEVDLSGDAD